MDTLKHCLHFTAQKMKAQREYPFSVLAMTNQHKFSSFSQFSRSVMSDSLWPMNCSVPGLPVHHQLPEFTQTHVHWVGDGIQPSHPLSSPSPPALNCSQHQGLFKWISSLHQVAKVLEFQLQHQSFQLFSNKRMMCWYMLQHAWLLKIV